MFNKPKKVLYITRDKVIATEVLDVVTKKFGKTFEFGWTLQTLDLAIAEAVKNLNTHDFRVLVSDELSYVVRLGIPAEVHPENIRAFLKEKLQEKIPDTVVEGEWDYKILRGASAAGRDVITFALVKTFAQALFAAIDKTAINVDAIESETLAKTRDANAYVGIALKEDLKGKDEDTLNITPPPIMNNAEPVITNEPSVPQSGKGGSKLIFILIPLILLGVLFGGFLYLRNSLPAENGVPVPTPTPESETVATPTPEPLTEVVVDTGVLKVQIQNGSGRAGEAGRVSSLLESKGFKDFKTANASAFDFVETTVSIKESAKGVFEDIKDALSEYTVEEAGSDLTSDSEFDVVIVVGKRK